MHPFSFDLRIPSVRTVAPLWQGKVRSNLAKVFLIRDRKAILLVIAVVELPNQGRVSIQGVKSLWGDRVVFPRLRTGDTNRWGINKIYLPPVSVPGAQSRKNDAIPQSDLTPRKLTLIQNVDIE